MPGFGSSISSYPLSGFSTSHLLVGTLNDQDIHFEKITIPGDGDCGFTALGVNRLELKETLFPLFERKEIRDRLFEEVYEAFITNAIGVTTQFHSYTLIRDARQRLLDKALRGVRERNNSLPLFSDNTLYQQSIGWLKTNGQPNDAKLLEDAYLNNEQAINNLVSYCYSEEAYQHYCAAYLQKLWLGCESAIIFAEQKDLSLYIWELTETEHLNLRRFHCSSNQSTAPLHILYSNGNHFDRLIAKPFCVDTFIPPTSPNDDKGFLTIPSSPPISPIEELNTSAQPLASPMTSWLPESSEELKSILSNREAHQSLTKIDLSNWDGEDPDELPAILKSCSSLKKFRCCNILKGEALQALLSSLSSNLEKLSLRETNITHRGVLKTLMEYLQTNNVLRSLSILNQETSSYMLRDRGFQAITEGLAGKTSLTKLKLTDCGITDASYATLLKFLSLQSLLRTLNFYFNPLGNRCGAILTYYIRRNSKLRKLNLRDTSLFENDKGQIVAQLFQQAVSQNSTLTSLSVTSNEDAKGAELVKFLAKNSSLTYLELNVDDEAKMTSQAIAEALQHNTTLTELETHCTLLPDSLSRIANNRARYTSLMHSPLILPQIKSSSSSSPSSSYSYSYKTQEVSQKREKPDTEGDEKEEPNKYQRTTAREHGG